MTSEPATKNHLERLAINDEGFIFDPVTGQSYTTNKIGIAVLQHLKENASAADITANLNAQYDIPLQQAERDIADFISQLHTLRII